MEKPDCPRCLQHQRQSKLQTLRKQLRKQGTPEDLLPKTSEAPLLSDPACGGCERRLASGRARAQKYRIGKSLYMSPL